MRRKIRPAVRYTLWFVVFVKLLLPPTLALPTGAAWWLRRAMPAPMVPHARTLTVSYREPGDGICSATGAAADASLCAAAANIFARCVGIARFSFRQCFIGGVAGISLAANRPVRRQNNGGNR